MAKYSVKSICWVNLDAYSAYPIHQIMVDGVRIGKPGHAPTLGHRLLAAQTGHGCFDGGMDGENLVEHSQREDGARLRLDPGEKHAPADAAD